MQTRRRLYFLVLTIFLVIMGGSTGYYILFNAEPSFMDCLYMTVVSLTTVGYGEVIQVSGNVPAEIFTMILITFGMGIILYGISALTASIIEGELTGILRKKKMAKNIQKLDNHFIVCGGGETGRGIISELVRNLEKVVLIENDHQAIERCQAAGDILYIEGDATEDENLEAAGLSNAAGIIVTLPSDKDNLYITMTARMLNKHIRIVSRMTNQKLKPKLKKAGADRVVSPGAIGALRMASEMIRPAAVDFLDKMLRSNSGNLRISQLTVAENSALIGNEIRTADLSDRFSLLILGTRDSSKKIEFNPAATAKIEKGMTLIVMGTVADIHRARAAVS